MRNIPNTVFLYILVGVVETAIIGKVQVTNRREGTKFFIDFPIGFLLSFSTPCL